MNVHPFPTPSADRDAPRRARGRDRVEGFLIAALIALLAIQIGLNLWFWF